MTKGPLEGLKVIDLTRALAGPFSSMLLADQGANVIKVEAPDIGDGTRKMPPFPPDVTDREPYGGYFQSINRNKHSIVIDLKAESGKSVVKRLVKDADVLIENFRSGVMEGLGLSYETLAEINPKLVYAAVRGFGDPRTGDSPYSSWPAYDVIAQAMGGMMSVTGLKDGAPLKTGPGVGDLIPGTLAAFGIMSALFHADRTGEGQFLDVAMYDAVLSFSERIVPQYAYTGQIPSTEGNAHPGLCPFGVFECKDGWVSIACPGDNFWAILCNAMGREDMIKDDRYIHNWARVEHMDEVIDAVTHWTTQYSKAELKDLLGGKIPFGPVHDAQDLFNDEHVKVRNMLVEVEQPGADKPYAITNSPIRMTKTQGGVRTRAPLLGEHTDKVLAESGFTDDEIAQLRKEGAIQ